MLLKVRKIKRNELKDKDGSIKKIPNTKDPIVKWVVVDEAIDVHLVKSARPFDRKHGDNYYDIKGDISVIYFRSQDDNNVTSEMHVVCNYDNLVNEINKLRQGHYKEDAGIDKLPEGPHGTLLPDHIIKGDQEGDSQEM